MKNKRKAHSGSSSSVLSSTTSDIGHFGVSDDIVVANISVLSHGETILLAYIGICFSSARIASLDLRSYFSKYFCPSSAATWMSSYEVSYRFAMEGQLQAYQGVTHGYDDR